MPPNYPEQVMQDGSQSKIVLKYVLVVIFITLGFLSFFFNNKSYSTGVISERFTGTIDHLTDSSIFIKGGFVSNNKLINQNNTKIVEAKITPDTKFNVTIYYEPSEKELEKTKGKWDMRTVKTEFRPGSMGDLRATTSVVSVTTNANILGKTKFIAATVSYSKLVSNRTPFPKGICEDAKGNKLSQEACMKKIGGVTNTGTTTSTKPK